MKKGLGSFIKEKLNSRGIVYRFLEVVYKPFKFLFLSRKIRQAYNYNMDLIKNNIKNKNIFYFGTPVHENLGDWAQTVCILDYFKKYWSDYNIIQIDSLGWTKKLIKNLQSYVKDSDLVFIQSGYLFRDGSSHAKLVKELAKFIKLNKIIIMPNTVNYNNSREFKKIFEPIAQNNNVLFLCRDKISYRNVHEQYKSIRVELFPDIVTTKIGDFSSETKQDGILLCTRRDSEKYYSNQEIDSLKDNLLKITDKIDIADTTDTSLNHEMISKDPKYFVLNKIKFFSKYKLVITDRFHGTIFSLVANVPVVVIRSTDFKLEEGAKWFKDLYPDMCYTANDLQVAEKTAENILKNKKYKRIDNNFFEKNYYSKLRTIIESF